MLDLITTCPVKGDVRALRTIALCLVVTLLATVVAGHALWKSRATNLALTIKGGTRFKNKSSA
jgi:hypothetical protein